MDDRRIELRRLTKRHNAGEATPAEIDRWYELRAELRRTDLGARRLRARRHTRVRLAFRASVEVGGSVRQVACVDLGAGGLRLRMQSPPEVGAQVGVTFRLPGDAQRFRLACRVVWSAPSGGQCGVCFEGVDPEVTLSLRAAVLSEQLVRARAEEELRP